MRQSWLLLLFTFSSPAFAVDGAGLTIQDIVLITAFLLLPAVPFLALAGIAILAVMLVRRVVRGPSNLESSSPVVLPPALGDIQFTDDEANLMHRWNIFFNGTQYRLGDRKFGTLAEALAAANRAKIGNDEL